MIRIPYGISNFKQLSSENYFYIDRTPYLRKLEEYGERFLVFLRPRRFGKSLFVSTLHYYYGKEHKADLQATFGKYDIGQRPTPLANTYLVLAMQFSGIDTATPETTFQDFLVNVQQSVLNFMAAYSEFFNEEDVREVKQSTSPQNLLKDLFGKVGRQAKGQKVYVLIDEYDHFANELLAFHFDRFQESVGKNGWVRKFYETLKEGTYTGVVDRIFITGVSPITLDSLTSGFNMAANLTTEPALNEMMGFTETEVSGIVHELVTATEQFCEPQMHV